MVTRHVSVDTILARGMEAIGDVGQKQYSPIPDQAKGTNLYNSSNAPEIYARLGHPTLTQLEEMMAALDGGDWALGFNTGMAAITALLMALPKPMTLIIHNHLYYGVWDWLDHYAQSFDITIQKMDLTRPEILEKFLQDHSSIWIWVEALLNPTWEMMPVDTIINTAHQYQAKVAVDNTAATPVLCQPLRLEADAVVYSGSKYLNGHHDILAGFVVGKDKKLKDDIWLNRRLFGSILQSSSAWDCWRGLRTLAIRMRHVSASADLVASFLADHPKVSQVYYPGLTYDKQSHRNAQRLLAEGMGGTVSFCPKGGVKAAQKIVHNTCLFRPATSYGGFCSLIEHRAGLKDEKDWLPPDLIRLSIGLEGIDDLIADLNQALETT